VLPHKYPVRAPAYSDRVSFSNSFSTLDVQSARRVSALRQESEIGKYTSIPAYTLRPIPRPLDVPYAILGAGEGGTPSVYRRRNSPM